MGKIRQKNNRTEVLLLLIIEKSILFQVRIARIFDFVGHYWPLSNCGWVKARERYSDREMNNWEGKQKEGKRGDGVSFNAPKTSGAQPDHVSDGVVFVVRHNLPCSSGHRSGDLPFALTVRLPCWAVAVEMRRNTLR